VEAQSRPEAERRGFVLLGDQPHEGQQDPLGFDDIVADLASLILASRGSTPFTLGIEAVWGMGKSTLMGRLCTRLASEEAVVPVLFNAWTADDGSVLEGLVKTVLNELDPSVLRRAMRNRKLISGLRVAASVAGAWSAWETWSTLSGTGWRTTHGRATTCGNWSNRR
jgi:hypothetical protein